MNPFIESLNHWGIRATDFAGPLLWQSSVLIAALLVLDVLLRRRARAALRYALWLLVLLKLLLPPSLALPSGLGYWLGTDHPSASAPPRPRAVSVITVPGTMPVLPASDFPVQIHQPKLGRRGGLLLVWLAGSAVLLGFLARRSWQAARLLRQSHPTNEELQTLLDDCRRQLGLRRTVRTRLSASACSPAVCGLWRPAVLLPRDLVQRLTPDQLRAVLFHELVHLQRHDIWVNCLQALLQVTYWWHPLVWLANARIRRVREEAVDEAVMVALGSKADTYPMTLLEVAKLAFARPLTALGLVGIFESKGALQQRVRRLLDQPIPRSAKLNVAGFVVVAACGALLLPMARGQHASTPKPSTQSTGLQKAANVRVECRVLEISDTALQALALGPPDRVETNGQKAWFFPPADAADWLDSLTNLPGVRVVSAPLLTLPAGVTGQFLDEQKDRLNRRDATLRFTCEVTPRFTGTDIHLTLKAAAELSVPPPPPILGWSVVPRLRELADVQVTVPDGGGVIVMNPHLPATEGGHWMLLAKPRTALNAVEQPARTDMAGAPPPVPKAELREGDPRGQEIHLGASRKAVQSKLQSIILDEVNLEGTPLTEVLRYLTEQSLKRDPHKQGVNFLANPNVIAIPRSEALVDPTTGELVPVPRFERLPMDQITVRISPALRRARLIDVLEAAVKSADKPIRYTIEPYGVVVSPRPPGQAQLETRIFKVDPKTFLEGLQVADAPPLEAAPQERFPHWGWEEEPPRLMLTDGTYVKDPLRSLFAAAGVNVYPPNQIYFSVGKGVLMVRATPQELDIIEKTIQALNVAPPQVTIEAKFIEAPEEFVKWMTLGTVVSPSDATNQMRILTDSQARAFLRQVEQSPGVEIVSAPKVTTLSGRQTQIQVVDYKTIVTGIDPQAVVQPGKTARDATNASPFITQSIPLGPTLDVIPHVAADGYTVRLTAIPSVTEFLSYDQAGPNEEVLVYKDGGQENVPLPLPRFRNRQMVCTASVWDGQTLLLYNPTVTVVSKRPSGDSTTTVVHEDRDRRLLVLITPTLIDPAGNPIHTPDNLPFDPNAVPPQPK